MKTGRGVREVADVHMLLSSSLVKEMIRGGWDKERCPGCGGNQFRWALLGIKEKMSVRKERKLRKANAFW